MLADVVAKVVAESGFAPDKIEDVVVGCANQGGEDSRCVARHAALVAGLPIEIPGSVLQRNCGSGLNAIAVAAQAITCGEGDVFVAGGVESMSRAPFVMGKAEAHLRFDDRRALPESEGRGRVRRRHDAGDRRQPRARLSDYP
jgi:acetyl-CoA C-acetyltransferase